MLPCLEAEVGHSLMNEENEKKWECNSHVGLKVRLKKGKPNHE